jgi:hypothetical protein
MADCSFCGGLHFGSIGCPYQCRHCKRDIRPTWTIRCICPVVCNFGCRFICDGHAQKQVKQDYQRHQFPLDSCMAIDQGFVCKEKTGHTGEHVGASDETVHCWRNNEAT